MKTKNIVSTHHNFIETKTCTVFWWDKMLAPMWRYSVIAHNMELVFMQRTTGSDAHPICVMDDFGNLVKVPA